MTRQHEIIRETDRKPMLRAYPAGMLGMIGDYFGWATSDRGALELLLFGLVVPAVVLLVAATALVWILAGVKWVGQACAEGFRKGWTR